MRNDPSNPDLSPDQLAAFLDGELDAAAAARVEAWLADDPAAAAELDGQRRVLRLWHANPPPEPAEDAWTAVLARVAAKAPGRARKWPRTLALSAGLAAAVLAAVFLPRWLPTGVAPDGDNAPLPVIAPGDVTIISMDDRDTGGLVVAAPPVREILLASQDDVSVMNVQSYRDDDPAPLIGEGEVPMIVAAPAADAGRRP